MDLKHELISLAAVNLPPSYFEKEFHITFENDYDDLDFYKISILCIDRGPMFALMRYRGHPKGTTTICLLKKIENADDIFDVLKEDYSEMLEIIIKELKLKNSDISWTRMDDPDL